MGIQAVQHIPWNKWVFGVGATLLGSLLFVLPRHVSPFPCIFLSFVSHKSTYIVPGIASVGFRGFEIETRKGSKSQGRFVANSQYCAMVISPSLRGTLCSVYFCAERQPTELVCVGVRWYPYSFANWRWFLMGVSIFLWQHCWLDFSHQEGPLCVQVNRLD